MTRSLVLRLMFKDWYLSRAILVVIGAVGALSVAALYLRDTFTGIMGMLAALVATIFLGILMPSHTIVNERARQNLAFVMSLPISAAQYTTAKILANLLAFLALWLPIASGILWTVASAGVHGGTIPLIVVAALAPFAGFAIFVAVAIVTESAPLATGTMAACNVAYSFVWLFISRIPGFWKDLASPVAIWSRPMQSIVAGEIAAVVLAFALTFYFQSKKTDFI